LEVRRWRRRDCPCGRYTNTAEGKIVAAALLDNYNNIVRAVRNQPSLVAARPDEISRKNAAQSVQATPFSAGDVIRGKIQGIKVFAAPSKKSKVVFTLNKGEELIYIGTEKDGFLSVQGAEDGGWVAKLFVTK
jgi:hypothetical protein